MNKKINMKINWFFGPKEYLKSGLGLYSDIIIKNLETKIKIKRHYINLKSNDIKRYIYQLLILPLKIIIFYRKNKNVFTDESFLLLTLFPFFPYKNSIIIIHDFRDFNLTNKNPKLSEKIYFEILTKSYKNLKKFEKIIAASEFTKKTLVEKIKLNSEKIEVVNNSFKIEKFEKLKNKEKIKKELFKKYNIKYSKKDKIIFTLSSEEERKNVKSVIKAIKKLNNVIFIKIGKPIIEENRKENLKIIKKLKLNNIYFLEDIKYSDLILFYKTADIFILASSLEGFARPPIEAQMFGIPVIVSSIEVLKDNLKNTGIFLKNEKSPDEIAQKIEYLIENKKLRKKLIEKGLINCKRFNIENNYQKFYKVLKEI